MTECSGCGSKQSNNSGANSMRVAANPNAKVKRVIGVVSGKGGVGKSTISSLCAIAMQHKGYQCAILDADITGPTIPKAFHIHGKLTATDAGILPAHTSNNIQIVSINLALPHEDDPVVYRGPIIATTVKQFWSDVIWDEVDYMFVDMPPGTGDVPLTVFQSLPIDGIIVVTSPQDLVAMIVGKAVKMAQLMRIPILGVVENYSHFLCPDCGKKLYPFGKGKTNQVCTGYQIPYLCSLPISPEIAAAMDNGTIESICLPDSFINVTTMLEELS